MAKNKDKQQTQTVSNQDTSTDTEKPSGSATEGTESKNTVTIETVAEVMPGATKTLADHVADAAKSAHADANHAAHGLFENFFVHLSEFKTRLAGIEGKLEGEAAAVFEQVKKLL